MNDVKIGIVGCGNISEVYIKNIGSMFQDMEVIALCDAIPEKAKEKAEKFSVSLVLTMEELLMNNDIEIILNLTTPQSHYSICKSALEAGKSTYVEKPLALKWEESNELLELAAKKGLMIGSAPDTFMGAGYQTARKLIDAGLIGDIVSASTFVTCHGHENWHPDPEFFYQYGGGPMYDRGPYNLAALIFMMGPVESVMGMTSKGFETRTITSAKKYGQTFPVEIPTHVTGVLKFKSGALCTILTSFDIWGSTMPDMEVHGKLGSLILPDTNTFGGEILFRNYLSKEFHKMPLVYPNAENSRGLGLADMAASLRDGHQLRASGSMGSHIVEIMQALHDSSNQQKTIVLKSTCAQPEPFPIGIAPSSVR